MTELDRTSQTPELGKETDTRRLYLEAMAVSLGASEINTPVVVDRLLSKRVSFEKIYTLQSSIERKTFDDRVESNRDIRSLGKLFLSECEHSDKLDDHNIGTWVLRLLFEDEAKGIFSNFPGKIQHWSSPAAAQKFEEYITKHKSDCKTI